MKIKNPLFVVKDMEKSKFFYRHVLGLRTTLDLGAHVVLTGGLALQSEDSWIQFTQRVINYQGNDKEIYFEEDDLDGFLEKLETIKTIEYVHPVMEHEWGQRVIRFYDPDYHIIEVGESMELVCKRFLDSGMTKEETAKRMGVPLRMVNSMEGRVGVIQEEQNRKREGE